MYSFFVHLVAICTVIVWVSIYYSAVVIDVSSVSTLLRKVQEGSAKIQMQYSIDMYYSFVLQHAL